MKEIIDRILKDSTTPPIIIIQGDHGVSNVFQFKGYANTSANVRGLDYINQKNMAKDHKILNAYFLPGGGNKMLYNSISLVNTFRLILNYYFGMHYNILEDRAIHALAKNKKYYDFVDITEIVEN